MEPVLGLFCAEMKSVIGAKQLARLDIAGIGLTVACAIHCLITPILLGALPLIGAEFLGNEAFESVMIVLIALLATFTFINGYRLHGKTAHFWFGALGLLVFLLLRPAVSHELEPFATLLGGACFVIGHYLNWKWSKPCETC